MLTSPTRIGASEDDPEPRNCHRVVERNSSMPRSLPPLTSLRAFEAAARHLSFTKAARELHVTPAAISHQIRGLETHLGVVLFMRSSRSIVLTDQGRPAAEYFRDGFDHILRGVDVLREHERTGALTVGVSTSFATRWL